jgi:cytochrome c
VPTRGLCALLLAVFALPAAAQDAERGTAEEAQAMVARAIALYDEAGMGEALRQVSKSPSFRDRDLYVFILDTAGTVAAHARYPQSVGANALNAVDPRGTHYVQEMLRRATEEGVWVDYIFLDPATGQPTPKSTWTVRHDMFIFACGIYVGEVGI